MTKVTTFDALPGERLGPLLRRRRRERGISVLELAVAVEVSSSGVVYTWETERVLPSEDNLYKLGAVLTIPFYDLKEAYQETYQAKFRTHSTSLSPFPPQPAEMGYCKHPVTRGRHTGRPCTRIIFNRKMHDGDHGFNPRSEHAEDNLVFCCAGSACDFCRLELGIGPKDAEDAYRLAEASGLSFCGEPMSQGRWKGYPCTRINPYHWSGHQYSILSPLIYTSRESAETAIRSIREIIERQEQEEVRRKEKKEEARKLNARLKEAYDAGYQIICRQPVSGGKHPGKPCTNYVYPGEPHHGIHMHRSNVWACNLRALRQLGVRGVSVDGSVRWIKSVQFFDREFEFDVSQLTTDRE